MAGRPDRCGGAWSGGRAHQASGAWFDGRCGAGRRWRVGAAYSCERRLAVYFVQRGAQVIVLLGGGSKRTQKTDIKRAKALASRLD